MSSTSVAKTVDDTATSRTSPSLPSRESQSSDKLDGCQSVLRTSSVSERNKNDLEELMENEEVQRLAKEDSGRFSMSGKSNTSNASVGPDGISEDKDIESAPPVTVEPRVEALLVKNGIVTARDEVQRLAKEVSRRFSMSSKADTSNASMGPDGISEDKDIESAPPVMVEPRVEALLGKNGIPIVRDEIHEHHNELRYKAFNGVLTLDSYTAGFTKIMRDYSVSLQDELEWNVFYEKLKAMHARGEVVLHIPSKEHGINKKNNKRSLDEMDRFEEECSNFGEGKIITDSALPYIMEEYQKRDLIGILGKNYNFNTYRRLAIALELGEAKGNDFLLAGTTFFLQLGVVVVVVKAFFSNYVIEYEESLVGRSVAIFAIALYMIVNYFYLERFQLNSTKKLVSHKRLDAPARQKQPGKGMLAWANEHMNGASRNIGWWMDVVINGVVYWAVIIMQIGLMFAETNAIEMVADSVALLFIMGIDDELSDLTDEQETGLVIRLTAKRIFDSVQDKIVNSNPIEHKIGALNPLLDEVHNYIIPQHMWSGHTKATVEFGTNGKWREKGWKIEFGLKKGEPRKIEAAKVTRPDGSLQFAGPAAKELYENLADKPDLFETWLDPKGVLGSTEGSVYLSVSCLVPEGEEGYWGRLGDTLTCQPELSPDQYVSELKKADEIVPLTFSSHGGGIVNGVFIVKGVANSDSSKSFSYEERRVPCMMVPWGSFVLVQRFIVFQDKVLLLSEGLVFERTEHAHQEDSQIQMTNYSPPTLM